MAPKKTGRPRANAVDPVDEAPKTSSHGKNTEKPGASQARKGAHISDFTLEEIAAALGGVVTGDKQIQCPGPGHSPEDRSLSIMLTENMSDGFIVCSHANDDWRKCADYVRSTLGLARGQRQTPLTPKEEAARKNRAKEAEAKREEQKAEKLRTARYAWNRAFSVTKDSLPAAYPPRRPCNRAWAGFSVDRSAADGAEALAGRLQLHESHSLQSISRQRGAKGPSVASANLSTVVDN